MEKLCFLTIILTLYLLGLNNIQASEFEPVDNSNLYELYLDLEEEDQEDINNLLEDSQLSISELKDYQISMEATASGEVRMSIENDRLDLKQEEDRIKHTIISRISVGYIFPLGTSSSFQLQVFNLMKERPTFEFEVQAVSPMTFRRGTFNVFNFSAVYHLGKTHMYVGPVFNLIWVNNPKLNGTRNFIFKSTGIKLGFQYDFRVFEQNIGVAIEGSVSIGGLNYDPFPFILRGAGAKISIPINQSHKK